MELVKFSPEEQAKIDADKARTHVTVVYLCPLTLESVLQVQDAEMMELAMLEVKVRADKARMQILSTTLTTNLIDLNGIPYSYTKLLYQWADIEKLEEMARKAALAGGGFPGGRRGA